MVRAYDRKIGQTMLMQSRDKYGMRQIVNARDMEDIAAGTPYLHYSPQLAAEGVDKARFLLYARK